MGFRINTNIGALNAHANAVVNNRMLDNSLSKLSSGLRINKAADDASGMAIADSLRTQASALAQAIANANDAIGIIQTADKAMDEQLKILDTIKAKSIQAASDSQSTNSRAAIQKDVNRLLEELDNIARTTSFNGQALLSGRYANKEFQIGAYSNETVKVSVKDTQSTTIGKILTTADYTAIGNTLQIGHSVGHLQPLKDFKAGTKEIYLSDLKLGAQGLGKGDVIKFIGDDTEYTIDQISAATGYIKLGGSLQKDMPVGTQMYMVKNAQAKETLNFSTGFDADGAGVTIDLGDAVSITSGVAIGHSNLKGLAVGDVISFTTSTGETGEMKINVIQGSLGVVSMTPIGGANIANVSTSSMLTVKERATFDNDKYRLMADSYAGNAIKLQTSTGTGQPFATFSEAQAAAFAGLGIGDKVKIGENKQILTIAKLDVDKGQIIFAEKLDEPVKKDDKIKVVEQAGERVGIKTSAAHGATQLDITSGLLEATGKGIAKGDIIQTTLSNGDVIAVEVKNVIATSEGISLSFGGQTILESVNDQTTLTNFNTHTWSVQSSATLGKDFTSSDYAQYTIEGIKIDAVQMTDKNGNGVANTGLGEVANKMNSISDKTNIKAVADVSVKSVHKIRGGVLKQDITINGELILAKGTKILEADTDGRLTNAINSTSDNSGVRAEYNAQLGTVTLISDGRAMNLKGFTTAVGINDGVHAGRINYVQQDSTIVDVKAEHFQDAALTKKNDGIAALSVKQEVDAFKLKDIVTKKNIDGTSGLLRTREDAMTAMNIVETAVRDLDEIRADLGAVQNQFVVTINNISVTRVNVQAAESQIRDVDFAAESASFSKHNILAQSGSFAMAQANSIQQNVLKLLQ